MWKSILICFSFLITSSSIFGQTKNSQQDKPEAVCIVGSAVDEAYETRTEEIALLLESRNFKVHRFYNPNNDF